MKRRVIQTLLGWIVILSFGTLVFAVGELTVLMEKPAKVSAKRFDEGDIPNHYQFELVVEHSSSDFKFTTEIQSDSLDGALENLKKNVRWKEPYLFVGWERGGGNASRGYLVAVFKLTKGKLTYIGEVNDVVLENGGFTDIYDKFELNQLTSHAESPVVGIVLSEKDGKFVVDLEKTWNENQKRFNDNNRIITYIQTEEKVKSESRESQLAGLLLFNAVLGKYCRHEKDTDGFVETAKSELSKERLRLFNDILGRVIPGELPRPVIEVRKY